MMPQVLLSGFVMTVRNMIPPFYAISHIIPLRYAFQAVVTNEFDCDDDPIPLTCLTDWVNQGTKSCDDSPCPFCCERDELVGLGVCPVTTCYAAY